MNYGCNLCGPGFVGPVNTGPGYVRPRYGLGFALLVVLFILLIIIGASFLNFGGERC
ncbi:YjcZ family sporulation protein [Psychrobacillus sp. NPDC096389]|uniref:YjcZ family sporulation protein n=1 Tax=Psychrobacillus sp. NPDC096389 TaxID=3364490 RepID=UPI0037F93A87